MKDLRTIIHSFVEEKIQVILVNVLLRFSESINADDVGCYSLVKSLHGQHFSARGYGI